MKKQYAVFDIDGTIARTSLLQQTVRELVARGKIGIGPGRQIEMMLHDYRQRAPDNDFGKYIRQSADLMFQSMPGGLRVDEYNEIIDSMIKKSLTNTYVYTRELIQTLKRNNFFLISISGSELKAVSTFSRALGFDAWVGEVMYVEENGLYKGRINTLQQPKQKILESLIGKFDLETRGSTAVGDTSTDIGVLEMVDSPIAFNPNQELFKIANQKGWMIVIERKDMVYGLVKEGEEYTLKQVNA